MEIKQKTIKTGGIKFFVEDKGKEVARAYLYILKNDLHQTPFGFMEDVFVEEEYRRHGLGTRLIKQLIKTARKKKCYKLIGTSRRQRIKVHNWYKRLGFKDWGKEFKMDF